MKLLSTAGNPRPPESDFQHQDSTQKTDGFVIYRSGLFRRRPCGDRCYNAVPRWHGFIFGDRFQQLLGGQDDKMMLLDYRIFDGAETAPEHLLQ